MGCSSAENTPPHKKLTARLEISGSVEGLNLSEFFLLLSSTGLAYRRCELDWVKGVRLGVKFLRRHSKHKEKNNDGRLLTSFTSTVNLQAQTCRQHELLALIAVRAESLRFQRGRRQTARSDTTKESVVTRWQPTTFRQAAREPWSRARAAMIILSFASPSDGDLKSVVLARH